MGISAIAYDPSVRFADTSPASLGRNTRTQGGNQTLIRRSSL